MTTALALGKEACMWMVYFWGTAGVRSSRREPKEEIVLGFPLPLDRAASLGKYFSFHVLPGFHLHGEFSGS